MLTFVVSDKHGKPSLADQRRIRSHVRRRRKPKIPSIETVDTRMRAALPPSAQDHVFRFQILSPGHNVSQATPSDSCDRTAPENNSTLTASRTASTAWSPATSQLFCIPQFALDVDYESFGILSTYHPRVLAMCSLQDFGLKRDLQTSQWHEWLEKDVAYAHSAMALSCVARDCLLGRTPSKTASFHVAKAVAQLNKSLSDPMLALQDSNVAIIINLGAIAAISTDYMTASAHVAGLRLIVRLRGGVDSFKDNPHLISSLCRLDLQLALGLGQQGAIHPSASILTGSFIPVPSNFCPKEDPTSKHEQDIHQLMDHRLARVFSDLRLLARQVNDAFSKDYPIPESIVHDGLLSAQYMLFHLEGQLHTIQGECIRMALLVSVSSMWATLGARMRYTHASRRIQELCHAVEISSLQLQELVLWVLMMGLVSSTLDPDEQWVRSLWQLDLTEMTKGAQWIDVQHRLQGFIWIDACHDKLGKQHFEALSLPSLQSEGQSIST
ncbi:hypothetical protein GQ53DRAFT_134586 [Thozetella sp. PMI_491]|nr:hypothetical protein GQ53DRAFT_134586 [Thozetella sp. PMI_491]